MVTWMPESENGWRVRGPDVSQRFPLRNESPLEPHLIVPEERFARVHRIFLSKESSVLPIWITKMRRNSSDLLSQRTGRQSFFVTQVVQDGANLRPKFIISFHTSGEEHGMINSVLDVGSSCGHDIPCIIADIFGDTVVGLRGEVE